MIQTWHITSRENVKVELEGDSLDEVTRQLPDGYYSTFRTYDGCTRVLGLASHLRRLYEPASGPEVDALSLRQQLRPLLAPYRPGEARVRAVMTKEGKAYVAIEPLKPPRREVYEKGAHVKTVDLERENPRLKSTTFIGRSDPERRHIVKEGIFEALLVKNGKILEGMTSNFFYVKALRASSSPGSTQLEAGLYTAREDILLGVTRQTVVEIARGRGLQVEYRPLERNHITAVDEAFITSSSRGIVPVIQIDNVTIGQGRPGPITEELMRAYDIYVAEKAEEI